MRKALLNTLNVNVIVMKKNAKTIAEEIISLVSQLAGLAGVPANNIPVQLEKSASPGKKDKSGATGGIRSLIEDSKFDSPKSSTEVIELLKQDGRHYPSKTVLMALLNLVRERILTRFKDKGAKGWKYAVRK